MSNGTTAAIVGGDALFSGRFSGHDLDVQGQLEGDVDVKGRLRIGKQGRVKAMVKAAVVEIEGEFEGELRADALTLTETAKARGTFVAKRLSVREGALLEGSVNPSSPPAPTAAVPAPGPTPTGDGGGADANTGETPAAHGKPEDGGKTT